MLIIHQILSTRSLSLCWILESLELPYELVFYEAHQEAMTPHALLSVHRSGSPLVLVDGHDRIPGMALAIEYIARVYDMQDQIAPSVQELDYVQHLFWLHYTMNVVLTDLERVRLGDSPSHVLEIHGRFWEEHLAGASWFGGETLSMADYCMAPVLVELEVLGLLGALPSARRVLERYRELDSFRRACTRAVAPREPIDVQRVADAAGYEQLAAFGAKMFSEDEKGNKRGVKTREKLVEALLELFKGGELDPSVDRIAQRAGVSRRSLFHHFENVDSVYAAAIKHHGQQLISMFEYIDDTEALYRRLDQFVETRSRVLEFITPVRRGALLRVHDSAVIGHGVRAGQRLLRVEAQRVFSRELERAPTHLRPSLRAAVCNAASWSTWNNLRSEQELDVASSKEALSLMLKRLLR